MKLFIVESPKKCKTLKEILGAEYTYVASVGHIRQIPKKGINIDIKDGFTPKYEITPDRKKVVKEIKDLAKKATEIILAMDPDREGEAIAWHIYDILPASDQSKCKRVSYGEITKSAVQKAIKNKSEINMKLVDAAKARQVLDRLIGYKVSPVLWYTAHINNSSAGRVQSIALKMVCERQKEIDAFKPEDFWYVDALLQNDDGEFWGRVVTKDKDNRYVKEDVAKDDVANLKKASYVVDKVEKKERSVPANPPFDTNSLGKGCSNAFGWGLQKTKTIAQKLYEKGMVTYIRSDSFHIAPEAIEEVRGLIEKAASCEYMPSAPNVYEKKSGASAQEAHECIRPTQIYDKGEKLDDNDEIKMYKLVRDRFIACQMTPMIVDTVTVKVKANTKHILIAKGQTIKFDGWSKIYKYSKTKEEVLPDLSEKDKLNLKDIKDTKHTTKPPPRHSDVKISDMMEKAGVGRPSTRPGIIDSLQKKNYLEKEKGKGKGGFVATPLGMQIYEYLQPNFKDFFMDVKYTSQVEDDMIDIADGKKEYLPTIEAFYEILQKQIKDADGDIAPKEKVLTGVKCSVCKEGEIEEKTGQYGKFFACGNYPKCKSVFVKDDDDKFKIKEKKKLEKIGRKCPDCAKKKIDAELIKRFSAKNSSYFIGCEKYPKCRFSESID